MTSRLQELHTKSALISEILRAAALRYTKAAAASATATTTTPIAATVPRSLATPWQPPPPPTAVVPPCPREASTKDPRPTISASVSSGLCFHTRAVSDQCLLCLLKSEGEEYFARQPPALARHRRCQSESENMHVTWAEYTHTHTHNFPPD